MTPAASKRDQQNIETSSGRRLDFARRAPVLTFSVLEKALSLLPVFVVLHLPPNPEVTDDDIIGGVVIIV